MGKVFLFISTSLRAWWHRKSRYRSNKNPSSHHSRRTRATSTTIASPETYWKLNAFLFFRAWLCFASWFLLLGFSRAWNRKHGVASYTLRPHYPLFEVINRSDELLESLLCRDLLENYNPNFRRSQISFSWLELTLSDGWTELHLILWVRQKCSKQLLKLMNIQCLSF